MDTTNNIISGDIVEIAPEQQAIIDEMTNSDNVYAREVEAVKQARHAAYIAPDGSDALFMKYQRAEDGVTKQQWLYRVAEINAAHPYPEKPEA